MCFFLDGVPNHTWRVSRCADLDGQQVCVCVFIPSPVKVGTLLSEVPGTPFGASFFEFELKPTGNDSADQTQHEFQHHIV